MVSHSIRYACRKTKELPQNSKAESTISGVPCKLTWLSLIIWFNVLSNIYVSTCLKDLIIETRDWTLSFWYMLICKQFFYIYIYLWGQREDNPNYLEERIGTNKKTSPLATLIGPLSKALSNSCKLHLPSHDLDLYIITRLGISGSGSLFCFK